LLACVYVTAFFVVQFARMRYVAAYLLAVLGGNDKPSDADVKKILSSVGIDADAASLKKVIDELKGKNLEEVIAAGQSKLATMPAAGAPSAAAAAPAAGAAKADEPKAAAKKEEPKEEEEEDEDMGFGLFD
jgi:large subunit ribosomal protein LP2